jgi:hypothetical protein
MYKTINGWTKAKMIEQINKHNNGRRAVNRSMSCVYQTADGNRCAAGCFIPDTEMLAFEYDVCDLVWRYPHLEKVFPLGTEGMKQLQKAHDTAHEGRDTREVLATWIELNVTEDSK